MQNKKIAVVISGCGVFDGAEIYETTLAMLRLDQQDAEVTCFAPDTEQMHVINHRTGEPMEEKRNVLTEASRINRGQVSPLTEARADDFDAVIVPGGFGVAKNLSDFAVEGSECSIRPEFSELLQSFHSQKKPIGLVCIAPALIPRILNAGVSCTIGHDAATAGEIDRMGGVHISCNVDDIVIDHEHRVITTPAYMEASRISDAAKGIFKLVDKVLDMAG